METKVYLFVILAIGVFFSVKYYLKRKWRQELKKSWIPILCKVVNEEQCWLRVRDLFSKDPNDEDYKKYELVLKPIDREQCLEYPFFIKEVRYHISSLNEGKKYMGKQTTVYVNPTDKKEYFVEDKRR